MIPTRLPAAQKHKRAFTLVEVLIATIVLGLGVLGLSALFAGAARQQQSSAELSRAVVFSQNAASFLRPKLGQLISTSSTGPTLANGVWDALMTDMTDNLLRSRLALTPGSASLFFSADGIKTTYVSSDVSSPPGPIYYYGTTFSPSPGVTARLFDPVLPHSRVVPDNNLRVRVDWGAPSGGGPGPGPGPGPIGGVVFQPDTDVLIPDPVVAAYDATGQIPEFIWLFPGGVNPNKSIVSFPNPVGGPDPYVKMRLGGMTGEKARIEEVNLGSLYTSGDALKTVVVDSYNWLNDQVVSINDRLLYEYDETFPGDKRPTTGYSVLYRVRPNGIGAEAAVITYALRPLAIPDLDDDELQFIPPETPQSYPDDSILREVPATLAYDRDSGTYLIMAKDPLDNWITDPGQILMMSSEDGVASVLPNSTDYGADAPVRVLTRRRVPGSVMGAGGQTVNVGVLNDSPRLNRATPIASLTGGTNIKDIHVWGVQPIVRSLGRDRTEWKITPIDIRIFNFTND
jgi:prepilin-type N-terminal cleavage/methylation domain-containing protein